MEWVTFFGGVALGGLASWVITRYYYLAASADQKRALADLSSELRPRNTLADFERFLDNSTWHKTFVDDREVWLADADNTIQIHIGERERDFTEPWTVVYPDKTSSLYPVYLKINGITIKQLHFIFMDGGRIFVPLAESRLVKRDTLEYFWNVNSLDVKVCRIIGRYYIYNDLEGVAGMSNVALVQ